MTLRSTQFDSISKRHFDVVILGGGINGAATFKKLSKEGYKVLLLDKSDFSSGTSQASAMMIWGGLLYLKNLDLASVYNFSKDRDLMLQEFHSKIKPQTFSYIPSSLGERSKTFVQSALYLYWALGLFRRKKPNFVKDFPEASLLNQGHSTGALHYEEGVLRHSDNRFSLEWILEHQSETSLSINYAQLETCHYNQQDKRWNLQITDLMEGKETECTSKVIINCAGVWTDDVNKQFGISSPYKHVLSKGVFIGYQRPPEHKSPLIVEMGNNGDTLTCIPWGPVSLWGPTETVTPSIAEGFQPNQKDVSFLQEHADKQIRPLAQNAQVLSMRCGIRPLAVDKDYTSTEYPLEISRHFKIDSQKTSPWISVYGGKISGCLSLSDKVSKLLKTFIATPTSSTTPKAIHTPQDLFSDTNISVVPLQHSIENEFCCTLEDYLRRRTNISQWIYQEGLGEKQQNLKHLQSITNELTKYYPNTRGNSLPNYIKNVQEKWTLLGA